MTIEDRFHAWGSGRDFAMGAMQVGVDAVEAVRVANRHCVSCGNGIDHFDLTDKAD